MPTSHFRDPNPAPANLAADAAEDCRGQHRHLKSHTDVAADGAETCRKKQRAHRGEYAGEDVALRDGAAEQVRQNCRRSGVNRR